MRLFGLDNLLISLVVNGMEAAIKNLRDLSLVIIYAFLGATVPGYASLFSPISANIVSCDTVDIFCFWPLMFSLEMDFTKMSSLLIVY